MAKVVMYNGGKESYYGCTSSDKLVKGKTYEVLAAEDKGYQTNYTLKGVNGEFNSVWFDVVEDSTTYMALAHKVPLINKRYDIQRLDIINGQVHFTGLTTSIVKEIRALGNNIYEVTTQNNVYIVQVN